MIQQIIKRRHHRLVDGLETQRILPSSDLQMIGPYILLDHIGPFDLDPGFPITCDAPPHPHIGVAALTYLFDGALTHRDSLGFEQAIRPGEVNWMISGRGITHSERLELARTNGARIHGFQIWAALPQDAEQVAPSFFHYPESDLPRWSEQGLAGHVIAGSIEGLSAPSPTYSPQFCARWTIAEGTHRIVPAEYSERAVYLVSGLLEISGRRIHPGQMVVFETGKDATIIARAGSTVIIFGGEPIGNRIIFWNFVSSSRERIQQAVVDWQQQRFKLPVDEDRGSAYHPAAIESAAANLYNIDRKRSGVHLEIEENRNKSDNKLSSRASFIVICASSLFLWVTIITIIQKISS